MYISLFFSLENDDFTAFTLGEVQGGTGCKKKRSYCLHLPEGANSGSKHSVFHPQSIKIQSDIFEEMISSTSTKSGSAAIDSEDPEREEVLQPTSE